MTRARCISIGLGVGFVAVVLYYWRPIIFISMILLYELVQGTKRWLGMW